MRERGECRAATRIAPGQRVAVIALGLILLGSGAACSSASAGNGASEPTTVPSNPHGVGVQSETFVDPHRVTPAWGSTPQLPSRTLVTTVYYPSTSSASVKPVPGATPDRRGGPYPLIVFAHGLGGAPEDYEPLLASWAAAGYVVAAPRFPLSSSATPGGPDGGDIVNQPADMSFVIDSMLSLDAQSAGVLAGLVEPNEIGAAGHSNGAITVLGLVGNTCCRDPRVKAAVVMAGTTEGFGSGTYELGAAPPLLLVHGTADELVPYRSAVLVFDQARGPKGLLTIRGGSHQSAAGLSAASAAAVIGSTTAFFDAYLRHQPGAVARIEAAGTSHVTGVTFDATVGSQFRLPVPPAPVVHLHATVTPDSGLTAGQTVTVHWNGYTAGKVVNVLECSKVDIASANSSGCDFSNGKILHPDPNGSGSLTMQIVEGAVGDGTCDATHPGCSIIVNNSSSTDPSETQVLPISFAP
jgi:dienelactone hydrolase